MFISNPVTIPDSGSTFYGLKMDAKTGRLTVDVINDNTPISPAKYFASFWDKRLITFSQDMNGHTLASVI